MDILGMILFGVGALGTLVFGIWLLVTAFQKSIVWGLAYMFLPFASLVYVVMNWDRASKPFLMGLAASGVFVAGIFLSPTLQQGLVSADKQSTTTTTAPQ